MIKNHVCAGKLGWKENKQWSQWSMLLIQWRVLSQFTSHRNLLPLVQKAVKSDPSRRQKVCVPVHVCACVCVRQSKSDPII